MEKIRDDCYIDKGYFGGYRMVYPFRNDDKTWNKRNVTIFLIKIIGIILIAILLLYFWREDTRVCQEMINDNVTACKICKYQQDAIFSNLNLNFNLEGWNNIT